MFSACFVRKFALQRGKGEKSECEFQNKAHRTFDPRNTYRPVHNIAVLGCPESQVITRDHYFWVTIYIIYPYYQQLQFKASIADGPLCVFSTLFPNWSMKWRGRTWYGLDWTSLSPPTRFWGIDELNVGLRWLQLVLMNFAIYWTRELRRRQIPSYMTKDIENVSQSPPSGELANMVE